MELSPIGCGYISAQCHYVNFLEGKPYNRKGKKKKKKVLPIN